jgi:tetratricopeptide (TPR) repeat protein
VIGELEKTTKENPLDLRSYLKLGELYNFYSQIDPEKIKKGEEVLNKALSFSPKNQQVFWHLAQNMIFQNKIDIAIDLAKKAIDLEPNLKESHLIFIRILKVLKKEDLLKSAKEKALSLHPEWEKEIEEAILNP